MFSSVLYQSSPYRLQEILLSMRAKMRQYIRENRSFEKELKALRASQWMTKSQLENYQGENLVELLRHAARNVPFYQDHAQVIGNLPFGSGRVDLDSLKLPVIRSCTRKTK